MRKRTRLIVIALAAVLGVGALGVSWAWFNETTIAEAAGGQGGDLTALTISSSSYKYEAGDTKLWPGHYAGVVLTVTNPSSNETPVAITGVAQNAIEPKAVTGGTNSTCVGSIIQSTAPAFVFVDSNLDAIPAFEINPGASATILLQNAVALDGNTPDTCEGMTFKTKWDVAIENR